MSCCSACSQGHACSGSKKPRKNPSPRPSSKLDAGTKSQIAWIMGNVHVGVPDEEVAADWLRRCAKAGATAAQTRAIVKHALSVHHKNLDLYGAVRSGRIGSGRRKR